MRKWIVVAGLMVASLAGAQTTPNLGLQLPNYNSPNWGVGLNYNFIRLDSFLSGGYTLPAFSASGLTLNNITGSTQCLQVNSLGEIQGVGASCGSIIPPGTANQLQVKCPTGTAQCATAATADPAGNITGTSFIGPVTGHASLDLALSGGTLTGGITTDGITPTGSGISDWHDTTGACKVYRGVVNVLDCGAVADGAWVAGGCGQTSPVGCWTGTDNETAVGKAVAAVKANGGGAVYFPASGTNVWMMGSQTGCNSAIAGSNPVQYALEALPPGITIEGAGEDTTTIMAEPGTGGTSTCWMFGNDSQPAYDINFKALRLDGNESTDSIHNDYLHPNNNGQGVYQMGAIYIQPEPSPASSFGNIRSLGLIHVQLTGFAGGKIPAPSVPTGFQSVLWLGTTMWDVLDHVSIYLNEWAAAIFTQAPDSLYQSVYMNQNSTWNSWPMVVELDAGTSRWTDDYWGGGGGANYVGLGVQNDVFANDINDYPGAGITSECSTTIFGCGSNYIFAPSGDRASQGNEIIGGTSTDTASGYPSVLVAGTTTYPAGYTLISGVNFNSIGPVPAYLVQEQGTADHTSAIGNIVLESPTAGDWEFLGSSSLALANQGATNTFSSGNLSDSAYLLKYCGTATFTSSTTSGALACSWVTSSSHCQATWIGAPPSGSAVLGVTASSGSVVANTPSSVSGTASVACSVN